MNSYQNIKSVNIVGVQVSNLDYNETIQFISDHLVSAHKPLKIFTPNVDFIVKAQKDPNFKNVLNAADLSLPDGKPLVWASIYLGNPLKLKVSGSTLFYKVCELARKKHKRIFLLGGLPSAAEIASKKLQEKYGDIISGFYCPKYGFENNKEEISRIIEILKMSKSDILVVGLGAPKQEYFIDSYSCNYNIPVSLALGGTIDFASGLRKMAPDMIKQIGFGWLWRLLLEPRRLWRRYLVEDMKYFYYVKQQQNLTKKSSRS